MKVLLCAPYEEGKSIVFGGITIWARTVIDYYKSLVKSSVFLDLQPFDRQLFVSKDISLLLRYISGIKEYLRLIGKVRKRLSKDNYDVVHLCSSAHLSLLKDLIMIRVAHRYHVKIIIHLHFGRTPEITLKKNWEWLLLKRVIANSDKVVFMDHNSVKVLQELGYNNIEYLPNPISNSVMNTVKDGDNLSIMENSLLFVGHVIRSKGVFELAEATSALNYTSLKIVGKCPDDTKMELLKINRNMSIMGELPRKDVIKEMLKADIFVLPSYTEGFPNVILESMACGCAIVATNVGAIPEMLDFGTDFPCGEEVNPQDVESLNNALKALLSDKDYKDGLRKKAVLKVNQAYTVEKVWCQLINIWFSVAI